MLVERWRNNKWEMDNSITRGEESRGGNEATTA